jgi:hypothetical protein
MSSTIAPAPGRTPIRLSRRWTAAVLRPLPALEVVAYFLDGQLVHVDDDPLARRRLRPRQSTTAHFP